VLAGAVPVDGEEVVAAADVLDPVVDEAGAVVDDAGVVAGVVPVSGAEPVEGVEPVEGAGWAAGFCFAAP
jgi:hypothetical protein